MANLNTGVKEIIVLCGPPGCGKDHFISQLPIGYYPVSMDTYVALEATKLDLSLEEAWRDVELLKRAERHVRQTVRAYMQAGVNVVWNAYNLGRRKRLAIVNWIPATYVKHIAVWELDTKELQRRHKKRWEEGGFNVGWDLVEEMVKNYTTPTFDEGWQIISVRKI